MGANNASAGRLRPPSIRTFTGNCHDDDDSRVARGFQPLNDCGLGMRANGLCVKGAERRPLIG